MANKITNTAYYTAIAAAIRNKNRSAANYYPSEMAAAIAALVVPADNVSFSQVNTAAAGFLANVTYDPSDYTYSELENYATGTTAGRQPLGATVTLPAGTLTVTDGSRSLSYSVAAGQHTIYNITPGNTGAYFVKNSSGKIVAAGLLSPTGSLRMIHATGTNIRDLGGWSCDGGTVKYGLLFRGGDIQTADTALLHDLLGIRSELNLKWDSEVSINVSPIGADVDFCHISGPWYTIGSSGNWLPDAHKRILNYIMDKAIQGIPVYFHCSAGADRTGTVAFLLEAMLGMSQSDMDKDYELTSFNTDGSIANARRRDENDWKNYIAMFSSYQGSTIRDKVVNWALTIGITIEKINAFRAAMIDGTPSTLTGDVGSVSVTRSLTGATAGNTANSNAKYQPYSTTITPDAGKVITAVQVTMGGADITRAVFSGSETIFNYSVSFDLTNCALATLPRRKAVVSGECFCCTLEADTGYSLNDEDSPTVNITMGGVSVATYYKDGVINIPNVTGNLVISVTAAQSAVTYTNQIKESTAEINGSALYNSTGYKSDTRYGSSMTESASSGTGAFTTGYIHLTQGDVIRFYGNVFSGNYNGWNSAFYKSDGTKDLQVTQSSFYGGAYSSNTNITGRMTSIDYDTTNNVLQSFVWNKSYDVWVKFTLLGPFTEFATVITINEEM